MRKKFELSEAEIGIVEEALFDYAERMGDGEAFTDDSNTAAEYTERLNKCNNLLNRIDKWKRTPPF